MNEKWKRKMNKGERSRNELPILKTKTKNEEERKK